MQEAGDDVDVLSQLGKVVLSNPPEGLPRTLTVAIAGKGSLAERQARVILKPYLQEHEVSISYGPMNSEKTEEINFSWDDQTNNKMRNDLAIGAKNIKEWDAKLLRFTVITDTRSGDRQQRRREIEDALSGLGFTDEGKRVKHNEFANTITFTATPKQLYDAFGMEVTRRDVGNKIQYKFLKKLGMDDQIGCPFFGTDLSPLREKVPHVEALRVDEAERVAAVS